MVRVSPPHAKAINDSGAHPRMLSSLNESKLAGGTTPISKTAEGWLRAMHERKASPNKNLAIIHLMTTDGQDD